MTDCNFVDASMHVIYQHDISRYTIIATTTLLHGLLQFYNPCMD